jgi:MFS family permease
VSAARGVAEVSRTSRVLLAMAAVAVAFAAADTYVVVLALPDMMTGVGVPIDQLQRAAPIVSGFLLGYVAMLPLIGRIADLRGRVPVLVMALVLFALGSLVTTVAYDMPSIVAGRFLQGVGGGGLVPATLALVADLYPVERRGVPLGVVSAVQEIGSVLGPLFGAAVLAVSDWRAIFAINLAVGLVLAAAIRVLAPRSPSVVEVRPSRLVAGAPRTSGTEQRASRPRIDVVGLLLVLATFASAAIVFLRPTGLMRDLTWGQLFIPFAGDGRWLTPIGAITTAALVLLVAWCWFAPRPLLDLRGWSRVLVEADLAGALLLATALGGVILAFATADPKVEVFSPRGRWYLLGAAVAAVAFAWHVRRAASPLVPRGALRRTPAWGALLVSFFVGAALIAALIDIPLFARTTVYPDDQLPAALVLVRFLVALPVGAVAGGYLIRSLSPGLVTAVGMLMAATGFVLMTRWGLTTIEEPIANVALVTGGLGFGLALAPVNAALLAFTDDDVHGVASAFVVVSRMVGMLVGISALTTIGLRRYYSEQLAVPPVQEVCDGKSRCKEFSDLLRVAGIAQEHAVFWGAAGCAVVAAVLALVLFRQVGPTRLAGRDVFTGGA